MLVNNCFVVRKFLKMCKMSERKAKHEKSNDYCKGE